MPTLQDNSFTHSLSHSFQPTQYLFINTHSLFSLYIVSLFIKHTLLSLSFLTTLFNIHLLIFKSQYITLAQKKQRTKIIILCQFLQKALSLIVIYILFSRPMKEDVRSRIKNCLKTFFSAAVNIDVKFDALKLVNIYEILVLLLYFRLIKNNCNCKRQARPRWQM